MLIPLAAAAPLTMHTHTTLSPLPGNTDVSEAQARAAAGLPADVDNDYELMFRLGMRLALLAQARGIVTPVVNVAQAQPPVSFLTNEKAPTQQFRVSA